MAVDKKETKNIETAEKESVNSPSKQEKKTSSRRTTAKNIVETEISASKKTSKTRETSKPRSKRNVKKEPEKTLDTITAVLWAKLEKLNVDGLDKPIAIQVIVNDFGTFYIEVKENNEKHIIQAVYYDRDGTLETSYDEIMKIANGGYEFISAVKDGRIRYQGEIKKGIELAELFK